MRPQTIKVTLGDVEYEIAPLPIREAREVRQKFAAILEPAVNALQDAPKTEMSDYSALAGLVSAVKDTLLGSVDQCLELLCDYSPEIASHREQIEEIAYDGEVMAAFVEVIKLLYPFGGLIPSLTGLPYPQTGKRSS